MDGPELLSAVEEGDLAAVRALLAGGADVNETRRNGQTALMQAAAQGHLEAVRLLLEAGASVNSRREDGMTALIHAAFFGHADVVQTLLDGGADLKARDRIGMTSLDWARAQGSVDIVGMLAAAGSRPARPTPGRRSARAEVGNGSGDVLGLPGPERSTVDDFDPGDDVLDLTPAGGPEAHTTSTRQTPALIHPPPAAARESMNGSGAELFGHDAPQTSSRELRGEASLSASEGLKETGAATYGGGGGDYQNSPPTDSYKYVGFFIALVVGSVLLLWILFQKL